MATKAKSGRRWGLWILALVTVIGAVFVAMCAISILPLLTMGGKSVDKGTILELHLVGPMTEGPGVDPFAELGLSMASTSLWDVRRALRHAASDDKVAGLYVHVEGPEMGLAQLSELVDEMRRFGEKKPVHVLLQTDMIGDGSYYAATGGTKVWATPAAFWAVNGFSADVTFWRGTLDKLHIEPNYIMMKEYKNSVEPFTRYEMSDQFREALTDVVGDMQEGFFRDVALHRTLDEAKVRAAVDEGLMTSARALELGLVDALGYEDEVEEALRQVAGTEEYEGLSLSKYLKRIGPDEGTGDAIAVVFGEGPIVSGSGKDNPFGGQGTLYGPDVAEAIDDAVEDDDVKAIVFRVNSPGGSAVGSDLVWRAIEQAQAKGKPVVVSMSSVAGSGGYWVAMGSDAIVAHPTTITGSIGVVFGKMNVRGFLEWIGAHVDSIEFADKADVMSPFNSFDEADLAHTTGVVEALYEVFKAKVAEGRKLDVAAVEGLAKGRIWSGQDAKDKGLVDDLGGLDVAIGLAATKAGVPADTRLVVYPEHRSFLDLLLEDELDLDTSTGLDPAAIRAFTEEMAEPRAWAWMPDVTLR